jgi:putative membrane protein
MNERAAFAVIGVLTVLVVGLVGALMAGGGRRPATLDVSVLPLVNACLNTLSAGLLVSGWVFIRRGRVAAHIACMLGAFGVSTLFLLSYVTYHYYAGSRAFTGQGWIRPVYFTLLVTHIVLAAFIVPLALTTIYRGWRAAVAPRDPRIAEASRGSEGRFDRHVSIARWTLPLWLYVSVTGVLVYWLLYHLGPGPT